MNFLGGILFFAGCLGLFFAALATTYSVTNSATARQRKWLDTIVCIFRTSLLTAVTGIILAA